LYFPNCKAWGDGLIVNWKKNRTPEMCGDASAYTSKVRKVEFKAELQFRWKKRLTSYLFVKTKLTKYLMDLGFIGQVHGFAQSSTFLCVRECDDGFQ
jgi:hypothetical protein